MVAPATVSVPVDGDGATDGRPAAALGDALALAEAELAAGDGQRDGDGEEAEDEQERTAFHRADATSGQKDAPSGRADGA